MKFFQFFTTFLFLLSAGHSLAQNVHAIVTVQFQSGGFPEARFAIRLNEEHAPRSVSAFMLLARPEVSFYVSQNPLTPRGNYLLADEDGNRFIPQSIEFEMLADDPLNPTTLQLITPNTGIGSGGSVLLATFTADGARWESDNPHFSFQNSSPSNSGFFLTIDSSLSYVNELEQTITEEAFYDGNNVEHIGGNFPVASLIGPNGTDLSALGWLIQNEMVDITISDPFNSFTGPWGDQFANQFGTVLNNNRFAVAFANTSLSSPNTGNGEVILTGLLGNPNFRGRHTHLGTIENNFFDSSVGAVNGGNTVVQLLVDGEAAQVIDIQFVNNSISFNPLIYLATNPAIASFPSIREIDVDLTINDSATPPRIESGLSPGETAILTGSTDLQSWNELAQLSHPINATEAPSFDFEQILANNDQAFFRLEGAVVTYPVWPSEAFADAYLGETIGFRGADTDTDDANIVLNVFDVLFSEAEPTGILFGEPTGVNGAATDLGGTHLLQNITYDVTGPYEGVLTMEGETLPETLRLRLYFDSHKFDESPPLIERYHRLTTQVVSTPFGDFVFDAVSEFGIFENPVE